MKVNVDHQFINGKLECVLNVSDVTLKELKQFDSIKRTVLKGYHVTLKPNDVEQIKYVTSHGFLPTYKDYKIDLKNIKNIPLEKGEEILVQPHPNVYSTKGLKYVKEIREFLFKMVKECAKRMPYDFDSDFYDEEFLFFGDNVALLLNNKKPVALACYSETHKGNDPYLYILYTEPNYRGKKSYLKLFSFIAKELIKKGYKTIELCTDATTTNHLGESLEKNGFTNIGISFKKILNN